MADDPDQNQDDDQKPSSTGALAGAIFASPDPDLNAVGYAFSGLGPGHGTMRMGVGGALMYTPAGKVTPVNVTENLKIGMKYFESQGWTEKQAAGILANGIAESGLNPYSTGDGGEAHGVFQWHGNRFGPLMEAYDTDPRMGASPDDTPLMQNYKMMNYELKHGGESAHGAVLATIDDEGAAGAYFSKYIERPAAVVAQMNIRAAKAMGIKVAMDRAGALVAKTNQLPTSERIAQGHLKHTGELGPYTSSKLNAPKPSGTKTLDEEQKLSKSGAQKTASAGKFGSPQSAGSAFNKTLIPGANNGPSFPGFLNA